MRITTLLANSSIVSAAIAGLIVVIIHLSNRDYDIISQPMSYYAVGANGYLMQVGILAFAASVLTLSPALARSVPGLSRTGIAVLQIAGASLVVAAIFPTDVTVDALPITLVGLIHTAASYLFSPCLVTGALLLSRRFDDVRLRHAPTFALAIASWVSLIVLTIVNLLDLQIGGMGQRIFLAMILLWLIVTALRLPIRLAR